MDRELISAVKSISEKINTNVSIYSENDEFSVSGEEVLKTDERVEDVYRDIFNSKTYFRFRYKSENFIGVIRGAGEIEKNYASLITAILESVTTSDSITDKDDYLKNIVLGESNVTQILKYMHVAGVPDMPCTVIIIITSDGKLNEIVNLLDNFKSNPCDRAIITDDLTVAYIKYQEAEALDGEFQSVADYAELLHQSILEELSIKVKVGVGSTVKNLTESPVSYQQAQSAIRMSVIFSSNSDVQTYKDYILIKMLEDLPKYKLQEFLEILLEPEAKNIFSDADMTNTAEEFLENNLNVSETSRNLFMHRNTLMYRLDKIDRATGLDIRKFQDAVTFRLISILYKLVR